MAEGKEVPTSPLSKKEVKRQRKLDQRAEEIRLKNQENRRFLLKAGTVGLLSAAAAGLGLNQLFGRRQQPGSETSQQIPSPSKPLSNQDLLPRETIQYYLTQLRNFDEEIMKNPNRFREFAPKIGDLAAAYFSNQMGYDKARYLGKMHFLSEDEFRERVTNNPDCIDVNSDDTALASIFIESQDINFNLTRILAKSIPKSGQGHPATGLFSVTIHELHHHSAPVLSFNNNPYKLKGALFLQPNQAGYSCPEGVRLELEEAIVQDSTERMLNKLGLSMRPSEQYIKWVNLYKENIINKLFEGDHKQLLRLHQETKQDEFFTLVGLKLGSPSAQARQAGEEYISDVLVQKR